MLRPVANGTFALTRPPALRALPRPKLLGRREAQKGIQEDVDTTALRDVPVEYECFIFSTRHEPPEEVEAKK